MGRPKQAETPLDRAASRGGLALVEWLDNIPTVLRPVRTPEEERRADRAAEVLAEQVEAIRQAKAGQ